MEERRKRERKGVGGTNHEVSHKGEEGELSQRRGKSNRGLLFTESIKNSKLAITIQKLMFIIQKVTFSIDILI